MEEFVLHTLSNVGVPAAICFYTLFEVKKSIEKLTDAFDRWSDIIDRRLAGVESEVEDLKRSIRYEKSG